MQEFEARALIPAEPALNVADLLAQRVQRAPEAPLFARPDGDGWRDVSGAAFLAEVVALAKGFVAAGIGPGERIGLLASTRYEWTLVDFAAWYAGAFVVPIYETSAPEQVRWILGDSGCCAVIVETAEHFTRVDEVRADLDDVREVWQLGLGDLDKLAEGGRDVTDEEIERRRQLATESDIATIIYTAGTTGRPKGCVLTHGNFVELARNTTLAIPEVVNGNASTLLFITLAHVFARFIAVLAVHGGVKVGHQGDTSKLLPALGSFRPTFLLAVPRVFEKVYNSAEQKAEAGGKGRIFRWAADTGIAYSEARDAGHVPVALSARFAVANALVFRTLRKALGGRVEWAVSGSAPLGKRLGHFYRAMGVTILEGYGLTETTAPATVNRPSKFKIGTVGPVLPGISVRIADDGEIEIRGIDVFREYWHNEEATADAFDDGWFRTGDIGTFDEDGYLTITGPQEGDHRHRGRQERRPRGARGPHPRQPDRQPGRRRRRRAAVHRGARHAGRRHAAGVAREPRPGQDALPAQAAELPLVRDEIQSAIDAANTRVSRAEGIRAFEILPDDFTEASGQLTPKLSVKRHVVLEQCAERDRAALRGREGEAPGRLGPLTQAKATPQRASAREEPGRAADGGHRLAAHVGLEPLEVDLPVEVVLLVLERLREHPLADHLHRRAVEQPPDGPGPRIPAGREAEAGHRQAALVERLRLAAHLDELRVEQVADRVVDVVAERAHGRRRSGSRRRRRGRAPPRCRAGRRRAPRRRRPPVRPARRRCGAPGRRRAGCRGLPRPYASRRAGSPSTTSAARVRAASFVTCFRSL